LDRGLLGCVRTFALILLSQPLIFPLPLPSTPFSPSLSEPPKHDRHHHHNHHHFLTFVPPGIKQPSDDATPAESTLAARDRTEKEKDEEEEEDRGYEPDDGVNR
jgi:hypothetical protein